MAHSSRLLCNLYPKGQPGGLKAEQKAAAGNARGRECEGECEGSDLRTKNQVALSAVVV